MADVVVSSEGAETGVGAGEFVVDLDDPGGAAAASADWIEREKVEQRQKQQ